eukprot:scaffold110378_cov63-Attheya_sp.AAC.1
MTDRITLAWAYEPKHINFETRYASTVYTDKNKLRDPLGDDEDDYIQYVLCEEPRELKFSADCVKESRKFVEIAVSCNAWVLEYASLLLCNDKDIVMSAVIQKGRALQYASNILQNDEDIVMAAITNDCQSIEFAQSNVLMESSTIWRRAIESDPYILTNRRRVYSHKIPTHNWVDGLTTTDVVVAINQDKTIALLAVTLNWYTILHVPEIHRYNVDLLTIFLRSSDWHYNSDQESLWSTVRDVGAVSNNGMALQFASEALRDNRDIVHIAVHNNGRAIEYIMDPALKNEKDLVITAVSSCARGSGQAIKFVSETMQNDEDVIRLAVGTFSGAMNLVTNNELKGAVDLVCLALQRTIWRAVKGRPYVPVDLDWINYQLLSENVSILTTSEIGFVDTGLDTVVGDQATVQRKQDQEHLTTKPFWQGVKMKDGFKNAVKLVLPGF